MVRQRKLRKDAWQTENELVEDILDRRVYTDDKTGCWLWRPGQWTSGNGYGKVCFQGVAYMVHRMVYKVNVGPIPTGYVLDHQVCHWRACCNPAHLAPTTVKGNTYNGRAVLFGRTR